MLLKTCVTVPRHIASRRDDFYRRFGQVTRVGSRHPRSGKGHRDLGEREKDRDQNSDRQKSGHLRDGIRLYMVRALQYGTGSGGLANRRIAGRSADVGLAESCFAKRDSHICVERRFDAARLSRISTEIFRTRKQGLGDERAERSSSLAVTLREKRVVLRKGSRYAVGARNYAATLTL